MTFDKNIRKGSRLDKIPFFIQPFGILAREVYRAFKRKNYHHRSDSMMTGNNDSFMHTETFKKSYNRAMQAAGKDFHIPWRIHQAIWCGGISQNLRGDIVELGTGRGMVMSAVLSSLVNWETSNKNLWLVDTFESNAINPSTGIQDGDQPVQSHYAESFAGTKKNFNEFTNVKIVKGYVPDCLDRVLCKEISFLHIDLNRAMPEVAGLEYFWERIVKGGVVLLDDYAQGAPTVGGHIRQYAEMNKLAKKLGVSILSTPTGQGIIIK